MNLCGSWSCHPCSGVLYFLLFSWTCSSSTESTRSRKEGSSCRLSVTFKAAIQDNWFHYFHIIPEFGWSNRAILAAEICFHWGLLWWTEFSSLSSGSFVPAPVLPSHHVHGIKAAPQASVLIYLKLEEIVLPIKGSLTENCPVVLLGKADG